MVLSISLLKSTQDLIPKLHHHLLSVSRKFLANTDIGLIQGQVRRARLKTLTNIPSLHHHRIAFNSGLQKNQQIMLFGENCIHETYYEILSVKEDASYEEIRNSYRSAILHSHPDKLNISHCTSGDGKFLKIQKAWEVLSDAELRVVYDNDLRSSRHDGISADEISIEDMLVDITGEEGEVIDLFYQCRCGDYFSINSTELETMGFALLREGYCVQVRRLGAFVASVVLPCGSCSLKTRVWVDSDMKIPLQDDQL